MPTLVDGWNTEKKKFEKNSSEIIKLFENLCQAPSDKRETILFQTDSSKCFLNIANIACFKPGTWWQWECIVTSEDFIVGSKALVLWHCCLSIHHIKLVAIDWTMWSFFFTPSAHKYSKISKKKSLQALSFLYEPVFVTPWTFSSLRWILNTVSGWSSKAIWYKMLQCLDTVTIILTHSLIPLTMAESELTSCCIFVVVMIYQLP